MQKLLSLALIIFSSLSITAQSGNHVFSLGKDEFLLDGKPFQIISGEMHPARIPREYWQHRIRMAKAMGCNTIAAYVFWNYQETQEGNFDFKTGNHDIAAFISLCKQEGMWVLLRPGPYVCAEWDFGGLPTYLLKIPDIKIRCLDERYMSAVKRYVARLAQEVKPLLCTAGGPILMVQIENEYGSYGNDKQYLTALHNLWTSNGINGPFYTADGPSPAMLEAGSVPGAAIGLDSGSDSADFATAHRFNPDVPAFSSETYPGWLTHWGESWAKADTNSLKKEMTFLLEHHRSVNLYVVHGGTNFGFSAGANAFSPTAYQPDITSYDYDAPINEQGRPTASYYLLRNLISKYIRRKLPPVPTPVDAISISPIQLVKSASIWDNLPPAVHSAQPLPMEAVDQNQGLMLYRTKLTGHKRGKLTIWEPHDYALVFLDGKFVDTIRRDGGKWTVDLPKSSNEHPQLDILVEGMGHINFAQFMIDRKGITDRVTLNGMTLMNWDMFRMPMTDSSVHNIVKTPANAADDRPGAFFSGTFNIDKPGDTYFDLSQYSKGMVYINGHLLGRYWNIGPQQRLYCPASWLKQKENSIIIFDLLQQEAKPVEGKTSLK